MKVEMRIEFENEDIENMCREAYIARFGAAPSGYTISVYERFQTWTAELKALPVTEKKGDEQ